LVLEISHFAFPKGLRGLGKFSKSCMDLENFQILGGFAKITNLGRICKNHKSWVDLQKFLSLSDRFETAKWPISRTKNPRALFCQVPFKVPFWLQLD